MRKTISIICFILSLFIVTSHPVAIAASATDTDIKMQQDTIVNINQADAETIAASIKGVGMKKAEAIVAFREANGPFKTIEEIALVKGIGIKTIKNNEDNIKLK